MDFGIVLFTSDRGISPADAATAAEKNGFKVNPQFKTDLKERQKTSKAQ